MKPDPRVRPERLASILREAAQMTRQGWCQGIGEIPEIGAMCALVALSRACNKQEEYLRPAAEALTCVTGQFRSTPVGSVIAWNDVPGQKAEVVADAMEMAAATVEAAALVTV